MVGICHFNRILTSTLYHPNPHFLFTDPSFPLLPSKASCLPRTAGENQIMCRSTPLQIHSLHLLLGSPLPCSLPGHSRSSACAALLGCCANPSHLLSARRPTLAPHSQKTICPTSQRKERSVSFLTPPDFSKAT